jgi:hypothetical protein
MRTDLKILLDGFHLSIEGVSFFYWISSFVYGTIFLCLLKEFPLSTGEVSSSVYGTSFLCLLEEFPLSTGEVSFVYWRGFFCSLLT